MKRKHEGENGAAGAGRRKKSSSLKALPTVESEPAVLVHKNRELALQVKRLKRKLKDTKKRAEDGERVRERFDSTMSSVSRLTNEFAAEAGKLLGTSVGDVVLAPEDDVEGKELAKLADRDFESGEAFARALFGARAHGMLAKLVAQAVPEFKEAEDDEDDGAGKEPDAVVTELGAFLDVRVSKSLRMAMALLRKVYENVLGKGDAAREEATRRILANETGQAEAQLRAMAKDLERRCRLYSDRVLALETQNRTLRFAKDDAEEERNVLARRLGAMCVKAMSDAQIAATAERLKATNGAVGAAAASSSSASSSSSSGTPAPAASSSSAAGAATQAEGQQAGEGRDDKEWKDMENLASERLREIEMHVTEKKGLVEELETLRSKVALHAQEQQQASKTSDPTGSDLSGTVPQVEYAHVVRELNLAQAEIGRAKESENQALAKLQLAQKALPDLEAQMTQRITEREKQLSEQIQKLRDETTDARNRYERANSAAKTIPGLENRVNEYKALVESAQGEVERLKVEVAKLKAEPPATAVLREKLEALAKDKWPSDEDKRSVALLQTDLAAKQKELDGQRANEESLEDEIQAVSEAFTNMQNSNKRLLSQNDELERLSNRSSKRILEMNESISKLKQQLRNSRALLEAEQNLRKNQDADMQGLQAQIQALSQTSAKAQEHAHAMNERLVQVTRDHREQDAKYKKMISTVESLQATIKELEASSSNFRKEREDALHKVRRVEEEKLKIKRKLEKSRAAGVQAVGGGDLRMKGMVAALRCPLRPEYWKDSIIIRCCHMFSRKALDDNLRVRNRKCPTCKVLFSKDDIRSIHLYHSNDYDDEN
ncbi:E3 ubiquitin-protein ligase BRE1B (BRE1-B) (RING finger protein 40) (RING-type E3 ubiquitin transferase BRE1B) [Durusdinium trenchii]|uniref:E3 ubiquitin protein ligase n=1 Tax=Durusdinium trenchii TaxID=1381693 RepID=A0ABP0K2K6_9DINO